MMRRKPAGIRDVAAHAGVSVGTVSNVLNRPETVTDATRLTVLTSIEELGFVRDGSASRLRSAQSKIVGLVVLDVANPFFTDVTRGAEQALELRGYSVVVCNSDGSADRQDRHLRFLDEQRVAGVLITPVNARRDKRVLDRLRARGLSVVLVDETAASQTACSVAVDDVRGGELAGEHLVKIGRKRIVYVSGPQSVRQSADRGNGLQRAVDAHPNGEDVSIAVVEVPALNGREGYAAMDRILEHDPDAVFCANDMMALGVLRGLFERGKRVPEDVALVGYDDIEFAQLASVPLTSIRQPANQIGEAAAALLVEECDESLDHEHRRITFSPELIVRRSTA